MDILTLSQIIFNFTATLAILIVGVLIGIIAFEILQSIRATKKLARDIQQQSAHLYRKIDSFLVGIASLSFMSKIFKKNKKNGKE